MNKSLKHIAPEMSPAHLWQVIYVTVPLKILSPGLKIETKVIYVDVG